MTANDMDIAVGEMADKLVGELGPRIFGYPTNEEYKKGELNDKHKRESEEFDKLISR